MTPTADEWGRLLAAVDGRPTASEVALALADARDIADARAYELVDAALADGPLAEREGGGMFPEVVLEDAATEDTPTTGTVSDKTEEASRDENPTFETAGADSSPGETSRFDETDFSSTTPEIYPPTLLKREQWMGRKGKLPFAPWGDRDADLECGHVHCTDHGDDTPEDVVGDCPDCRAHREGTTTAACDHDARYKWGHAGHYVNGETVAIAEDDPRLDGRVFLQQDADPFAFVDGDDVRCPETGDVHPEFVRILDALGVTYADVSTSGSGVHAYYIGALPAGQGQAVFEIGDELWGANDDPPTVEIYANTHVCVATGDHVDTTPLEVAEWDADAVADVLDEYDAVKETAPVDHDTDRELDLGDHEPTATGRDETTDDVRDVLQAVDRLQPSGLPLRTRQVGTDGTGWEKWDPSTYRSSSGNDSLHRPSGEPTFFDQKHGESFGVLSLFAAEQGIITKPWNRLEGAEWWEAVDAARDAGAAIPEYEGGSRDTDHVPVLPESDTLADATSGWDWRHASRRSGETDPLEDARARTVDTIADAMGSFDNVLVEALPTLGKSYGTVAAAARTDEPVTVLTTRGHKEQYQQIREWCDEHGLSTYTLPSFTRDCDTANGEHGDEWAKQAKDWYRRGATPKDIHKNAEYELGRPLPCQEHEGQRCPYASKWDFDPDDYDVLIGHYAHAHKGKVTSGRTVVFDEFPEGAYETCLDHGLEGAITYFLQCHDALPFDDYTDLIEGRHDDQRRGDALTWFGEETDRDGTLVFGDDAGHADAPLAALTILAGATENLGNGWERANLGEDRVGLFNREQGRVWLLTTPGLAYTRGVLALDGTPTVEMWELALGERLNHRPVLSEPERQEYLTDALNLNVVRTTDAVKPYNNPDHVSTAQDGALLEAIHDQHGQRPAVISSRTALDEYEDAGVLAHVDETGYYGNVLGSNQFAETRLGAVVGSTHYGDGYIKKWSAYAGEVAERGGEKGAGLSYGGFGDRVLTHMREHETLQAVMRFGRDGKGAAVYVHTDTLPDWVPLAGEGRVVTTWSDGMKQVVTAAADMGSWKTTDLADHPAVSIGERQIRDHLHTLAERGFVDVDVEGRGFVWRDTGLHRVGEHGDVELTPVELASLGAEEVAELSRTTYYTWEFRNPASDSPSPGGDAVGAGGEATAPVADAGDGPPDGGGGA